MRYWSVNQETNEVDLASKNAKFIGGLYHIPVTAITFDPKKYKEGFVVILTSEKTTEYIEDHRDKTIWDTTDCTKYIKVNEIGEIKTGFTFSKPKTQFDEWINEKWVTNVSNQHIAEYDKVDNIRRALYAKIVSPLIEEANIKRLIRSKVAITEAGELEQQALAARVKIQQENPWPTPPAL